MKVLTNYQPFAQLIVDNFKSYETRSWATEHRGILLIHASKRDNLYTQMILKNMKQRLCAQSELMVELNRPMLHGAIIGAVNITDCIRIDKSFIRKLDLKEFYTGEFYEGWYAWKIESPLFFKEPIPISGKPGLWDYKNRKLEKQLKKVMGL